MLNIVLPSQIHTGDTQASKTNIMWFGVIRDSEVIRDKLGNKLLSESILC